MGIFDLDRKLVAATCGLIVSFWTDNMFHRKYFKLLLLLLVYF